MPHDLQPYFLQLICTGISLFQNVPCFFGSCSSCNLLKMGNINTLVKKTYCLTVSLLVLLVDSFLRLRGPFRKAWVAFFHDVHDILIVENRLHLDAPSFPILAIGDGEDGGKASGVKSHYCSRVSLGFLALNTKCWNQRKDRAKK